MLSLLNHSRRRKQQHIRCFHHRHSPHQVSFKSVKMVFSRFLRLILLLSLVSSSFSYTTSPSNFTASDQTLRPQEEIQKLKLIRNELLKINKPAVKTIQVIFLSPPALSLINVFIQISLFYFIINMQAFYSVFALFILCLFSLCYVSCRAQTEIQ